MSSDYERAKEMCDLNQHDWEYEYYGDRCKICGLFVPDGCGWWLPAEDDEEQDCDNEP